MATPGVVRYGCRNLLSWATRACCLSHPNVTRHVASSVVPSSSCSGGKALSANFLRASKADSRVEKSREVISREEQELLESAPTCQPHQVHAQELAVADEAEIVRAAEIIVDEGVLFVKGLLGADDARDLRAHVDGVLERSVGEVVDGGKEYTSLFGPVLCRKHRYDVLLPLDHVVAPLVRRALDSVARLMEVVGDECRLCELSALVSDPGSFAQPIHHDIKFDGTNPRVTMLVALQDVTPDMGPTLLFPRTNTPEWHLHFMERGDTFEQLLDGAGHVVGLLKAGDAIMYDARVLHCGGANHSNLCVASSGKSEAGGTRRTLLAISAQVEAGGNTAGHTNILAAYRGKFRIDAYKAWTATPQA